MLKRIFFLFLAATVLLTVCILPAAAAVVTPDNVNHFLSGVLLDLQLDSIISGRATYVDYSAGGFTPDPNINYPSSGGVNLYDPGGYVIWAMVPTSEYYDNTLFGCLFGAEGLTYYPSYYLESTIEILDWTIVYKSFTANQYHSIFSYGAFPSVFNIYTQSSRIGEFTSVDWGFASASVWSNLIDSVQALQSYENGIGEGSTFISSPFLSSELSLSYYYQGSWINIPITVPDLNDYITGTTVNLNILQNLGIESADIPSNNGGLRLCFTLPYAINMSAFSFGAFVPNNLVLRYDPADIRSERFGVWFNNTVSNFSLWPLRSIAEGNTFMYDYNFPPNRSLYNQICIELNENALRSALASNTPVSDYISYRLVDFNATYGSGYDAGYDVGYGQGELNGYNSGKQQGYLEGKAEGLEMSQNGDFFSLFSALIDAPVSAFTNLLSFEIFNQNVASFVLSILSLIVVFKIVKVVI